MNRKMSWSEVNHQSNLHILCFPGWALMVFCPSLSGSPRTLLVDRIVISIWDWRRIVSVSVWSWMFGRHRQAYMFQMFGERWILMRKTPDQRLCCCFWTFDTRSREVGQSFCTLKCLQMYMCEHQCCLRREKLDWTTHKKSHIYCSLTCSLNSV